MLVAITGTATTNVEIINLQNQQKQIISLVEASGNVSNIIWSNDSNKAMVNTAGS